MTVARTEWRLVILLQIAGLFAAAQFGKVALALPEFQAAYPEAGLLVPLMVSAVGLVGILFGAVAGPAVSGFGLARGLIAALMFGGILSLLQVFLPPLPLMAGLRLLEGVSHLAIVVAAPTLLSGLASDADRPVVMGLWACFFGMTMVILAVCLPVLLAWGGLGLVFGVHGAGMILIGLILWRALPADRSTKLRRPAFWDVHRALYIAPRLILPGAGFVWYTILYIALLAVLPLVLDLSVAVMTALPLISIIGTLTGGFVAKKVRPDKLVLVAFFLTALAGVPVVMAPGAFLPLGILFFVMAFIPAGSFAAIPHFNAGAEDRARATGGLAQLGNVGTTLGTPVFVVAAELGGLVAITLTMTVFCAIAIAVTLLLVRQIK